MRFSSKLVVTVLVSLAACSIVMAQDPRGSIAGRVVDQSDAVVVGAKVQAFNSETGVVVSAETNETGRFRIPFLLPGKYRVAVEMAGFKTYTQDNVPLRGGDVQDLTIQLVVGAATETIEVHAETAILETGTSTLGQVMDERRLTELPQKGGNPLDFARLIPGVTSTSTLRTQKSASPDGTSQISVNGSGVDETQFQIDGVNNTVNDKGS